MAHKNIDYFRANLGRMCAGYGNVSRTAKAAGITREYLSTVIHGDAIPSLEVACQIADALQVPLEELFRRPAPTREPAEVS